jgi:ankyrin repeat protein
VIDELHGERQCSEAFLSIGLFRACDKNFADIARYLLTRGADPNYVSGNKLPSLLRAAEYGLVGIAEALTDHNVELECRDKKGRTALMTAAWKGHLDIVQLLIQRGAQVDNVDLRKRNVLHNIAADRGDEKASGKTTEKDGRRCGTDIVQYLLQAGVNLDARDELGRTPLHWACVTGNEELVKVLLTTRFGGGSPRARTNVVDARMKTPLHFAASHNRGHLVELLVRHGADIHAK